MLHTFSRQFLQPDQARRTATPDGVVGVIETVRWRVPALVPCCARRSRACPREHGNWSAIPATTTTTCAPPHAIARFSRGGAASADFSGLRQFLEEQKIRVISYREFAETPTEAPATIRS